MDIKKVFCIFIAIMLLLLLISCGVNPAAKYPIIEIKYSEDMISTNPSVEIQTLGYSFGEGYIFEYDNGTVKEKLTEGRNLYTQEYITDNVDTYFILNPWKSISWDLEPRYDLHQKAYIISIDAAERWTFNEDQIILTVADGYAYYLEGVEIHKMNLDDETDETDDTVVYTFPFLKKLPKNPMVTIDGVKTDLSGWYIFTISEQSILIQGQNRYNTGGETIYYDFADIEI